MDPNTTCLGCSHSGTSPVPIRSSTPSANLKTVIAPLVGPYQFIDLRESLEPVATTASNGLKPKQSEVLPLRVAKPINIRLYNLFRALG